MIRVYECSYKRSRLDTRASFRRLNFGSGGSMIRAINGLDDRERKDTRVVYAKSGSTILGWAILVDPPIFHSEGTEVHFYVDRLARRRGIGTRLMNVARKHWGPEFQVCRHDEISSKFFNSCSRD